MDPALERRIQDLMVGLDESMQLVKSELSHMIAGESEGQLKSHNHFQPRLSIAIRNRSRKITESPAANTSSSLKTHALNRESIAALYEYHKPPGFTLKQFGQFVRSLPRDDVQDLVDAIQDEEEGSERTFSLNQFVQNNVSRKALGDKLWDEYGPSFGLSRKEFFAVVNLASPRDLAELVIAMESDRLEEPVQKQARTSSQPPGRSRTSLASRLPALEPGRGVSEIALQNTKTFSLGEAPFSTQPCLEIGAVDMGRKRRRSDSLDKETRQSQLEDDTNLSSKSLSIPNTTSIHDARIDDDLQGKPSRKKRKRYKKKSSQHNAQTQVINYQAPTVRTTQADQEATSKAIRRRKKKERRRERRRRRDEEQLKTAPRIDMQGNVRAADALKSVKLLDDQLAEQPISSGIPTQAHSTRYFSPELGDVVIAEQMPATAKSLAVDDHDSAYEESTSVEDENGELLQDVDQIQVQKKPAAPNQYSSRMSTPPLLTFDQETGEMLCIPESPFRPSAIEPSDSEMSDEEGSFQIGHQSQSPLEALMDLGNKMLEYGGAERKEPDVGGSKAQPAEHTDVDLGKSIYEKPELDEIELENNGLPTFEPAAQPMDTFKGERLQQEEAESDNDFENMVLYEGASISALESRPITHADGRLDHTVPMNHHQISVFDSNLSGDGDDQYVSVPGEEPIKFTSREFSKSPIIGLDRFDNSPPSDSKYGLSTRSQDRKEMETQTLPEPSEVHPESEKSLQTSPNRRTGNQSQHFQTATASLNKSKRPLAGTVSCIPFPPLSAESFGLIQEKVAHDPFKLLVAVTLLNKTKGTVAIPMFHTVMQRYPTIADLAHANIADLAAMIKNLGLQNSRANTLVNLAKTWIKEPPVKGKRHRTLNYPVPGAHRDIRPLEVLDDDDERLGAFEIGHLPGCGSYARDSWRIFCRDRLRGLASGYDGEGAHENFQPEWTRVVPEDKELRAFLRWNWLRKGFAWDPLTGEKEVASAELREQAEHGHMSWNDPGLDNTETSAPIHKATLSRTDHVDSSPQVDATVGASLDTKRSPEASDRGSLESDSDSSRRGVIATKTPAAPIYQNKLGISSHPVEEEGPITKLLKLSERRKSRAKKGKSPGKRRSKRLSATEGIGSIET